MTKDYQEFRYTANDGLRLAGRKYGWRHRDNLPVVCLAGLSRNSADFHELALYLANHRSKPRRILTLDYRGRGRSDYDPDWNNYNVLCEAGDVIDGIVAAGLSHVAIAGTSRGGLIALALAAIRPGMMKAVIFNDIAPEIEGTGLVRIKNYLECSRDPKDWDDAVSILRESGQAQFTAFTDADWLKQAQAIFRERNGKLIRDYDPNLNNTLKAISLDQPLPSLWPQLTGLRQVPLLLIHGENSDLISSQAIARMKEIHPKMGYVAISGQGHAPDLASAGLPDRIATFLEDVE